MAGENESAQEKKKSENKQNGKIQEYVKAETARNAVTTNKQVFACSAFPEIPLPEEFVTGVQELEKVLGMPVWMLVQNRSAVELVDSVWKVFYNEKDLLENCESVALIIHSPGGQAKAAYQIASLLQRKCKKGFKAVVPQYAKSAATLLTLGASEIILNDFAELGPLDAQLFDREREGITSALDEVQALERLHASSLEAIDQAMYLLLSRTGKKVETLLPHILNYAAKMMHPLLDKIDTVHFTQMSRVLKVAEEYATRLLKYKYPLDKAQKIARRLVENYPEHGFVIDHHEAQEVGLDVRTPISEERLALTKIEKYISRIDAIGSLKELNNEHNH